MTNYDMNNGQAASDAVLLELYTEGQLSSRYGISKPDLDWKEKTKKVLKRKCACSSENVKKFFFTLIPILHWLPRYKPKKFLIGDVAAGLTVGIVHLPQGMAYALLASMPAVTGLYVSFFPVLIYVLFGSSKHVSIGTFAVVSLMVGEVINNHVKPCHETATNSSIIMSTTAPVLGTTGFPLTTSPTTQSPNEICEAENAKRKMEIAVALAIANGIIQIGMYISRLGVITLYLSDHLVSGFTCGAAFHVLTSQVPKLFGLVIPRHSGPLALIYTYIDIFKTITKINWATFIVSLCCILFLVAGKGINARFREKLPIPLPWELAVVIFSTIASYFGYLNPNHNVQIVGSIPTGIKTSVPAGSDIAMVLAEAIPIAIVAYAIEISLSQMFAVKHSYEIDSNQELLAMGIGNVFGSFFSCYPCAASLSRSVIWEEVGAHTQITGVVSSGLILIILLWIGPLFESLPQAALAAIIVVNLKGLLRQFEKIKPLWKVSKLDALTWIVTWAAVVLLGVEFGLAIAVGFGLLTVIFRTQMQQGNVLGDVGGSGHYRNTKEYRVVDSGGKITVFQFSGPLYFANRERFKSQVTRALGFDPIMRSSAMKKNKKPAENDNIKNAVNGTKSNNNYSATDNSGYEFHEGDRHSSKLDSPGVDSHSALAPGSPSVANGNSQGDSFTYDDNANSLSSISFAIDTPKTPKTHFILDMSATTFVDNDGAKTIKSLFMSFSNQNIVMSLVSCNDDVMQAIKITCQEQRPAFFLSLDKALDFASGEAEIALNDLGDVVQEVSDTLDTAF